MSRKRRQVWLMRCDLCQRLTSPEDVTRVAWESPYGDVLEAGLVCPQCMAYLPASFQSGLHVWTLVLRSP